MALDHENLTLDIILSIIDEEGEIVAHVHVDPEQAGRIAAGILVQAHEAHHILEELANTPLDDRPAAFQRIIEASQAGQN